MLYSSSPLPHLIPLTPAPCPTRQGCLPHWELFDSRLHTIFMPPATSLQHDAVKQVYISKGKTWTPTKRQRPCTGGMGEGAQGADMRLDSSKSALFHFSISVWGGNTIHHLVSPEEKCYQGTYMILGSSRSCRRL